MLKYILYLIFLISVAMAAIGVILASRLRNKSKSDIFSSLLYYQVFIFTFGFYGIWGQVLIKSFLSPVISTELLLKFTDISTLLGLPFLVFAWLMLTRFSLNLSGRKTNNWFVFWFLFINISLLLVVGYFVTVKNNGNNSVLMKDYFIIMNLIYSFLASSFIHFTLRSRSLIHDADSRIVAPSVFFITILQCIPLVFYKTQPWLGIIFIFTFFTGYTFLPIFFSYGTLLTVFSAKPENNLSFDEFCRKYEVSPRESDIIREICNGLNNKEISDRLFISLQTVKDHTHRIYIKTNVKSRVQLINLVRETLVFSPGKIK